MLPFIIQVSTIEELKLFEQIFQNSFARNPPVQSEFQVVKPKFRTIVSKNLN